jgi:hypothetical protein
VNTADYLKRTAILVAAVGSLAWGQRDAAFSLSFDPALGSTPLSGRIILLLSRTERFSPSENGTPFFGMNVEDLKPGASIEMGSGTAGYPIRSLSMIPAGEYYVQAWLNVYTTFRRSDGHTVHLHNDEGEGQNWRRSPGNLYSEPRKVRFDPHAGGAVSIVMDRKVPPIDFPDDTEWVKTIRIQSPLLTRFWGTPMYLGARVLLPKGFDDHPEAKYPVVYVVGHFSMRNPGGFQPDENNPFYRAWTAPDMPRMLLVTLQHANPYYDDSYGVNSENVGPYGDAITQELMPYVERRFRAIGKPYARVLTGGSTGGWISLAMQVFYPDFFGGTWSFYPDPVDFRKYQIVNLYEDVDAYYEDHEWTKVPRPAMRDTDGSVRYTMEQENLKEEVLGTRSRSGGQWAIWNAVFAPVAEDGYPKPLWNPVTGKIDHDVAEWAKEHYDIRYHLEKNWTSEGPKLAGKLNIFCGRMDNYYLDEAVYLLDEFMSKTQNPHYAGRFEYGDRGGHGWSPYPRGGTDLYREMAAQIVRNTTPGESTQAWHYR